MNTTADLRQRLGRRISATPYYQVSEETPTRLVLQSYPQANLRHALSSLIGGGGLVGAAIISLIIAYWADLQTPGDGFGSVALVAVCMGLLGAFGFVTLFGGIAVATTANTIVVDREDETITYTQQNRVSRPRRQTLPLEVVQDVVQRTLSVNAPNRPANHYVLIELHLTTGDPWMVDSAADEQALAPTYTALKRAISPHT